MSNQLSEFAKSQVAVQNGNGYHYAKTSGSRFKPLPFRWASDIEPQSIDWLWKPFIAYGTFTILEGEEGLGKSFLTTALAAAQASGYPLPNGEKDLEPGNVMLLLAEDSAEITVVPRLKSLQADRSKIAIFDEPFALDDDGVLRLEMRMAEIRPRLVIIDPLFAFTKGNVNNESDTRPIASQIKKLAEKYDCAIVGIRHIGKAKGHGDPRSAGMASIAWRAAARSVLLVGKNPDDERQKAICQTKSNLDRIPDYSIGFEICASADHAVGEFFWTGESTLTASKMLAQPSDEEKAGHDQAVAALREILNDKREHSAKEVLDEMKSLGYTEKQIRTARESLKIVPRKQGGFFGKLTGQNWTWKLPEDALEGDRGHLQQSMPKQRTYRSDFAEDALAKRNGHLQGESERATEDAGNVAKGHLQQTECVNVNKTGHRAEDALNREKGHLQQAEPGGGNLFNTSLPPRTREHEKPANKTCVSCDQPVESYTQNCPHCGDYPAPF